MLDLLNNRRTVAVLAIALLGVGVYVTVVAIRQVRPREVDGEPTAFLADRVEAAADPESGPVATVEAVPSGAAVKVADYKGDPMELIRAAVVHNAAARNRLTSYTIEQEWTDVIRYASLAAQPPQGWPEEDVTSHERMRLVRKGTAMFVSRTERLSSASGAWSRENFRECALNEQYFAVYDREPNNLVRVWEHTSTNAMQDAPKALSTELYPRPCAWDFVFGKPDTSLEERFNNGRPRADKTEWTIRDAHLDGDPVYQIVESATITHAKTGKVYEMVTHWFIDPNRDFLLRRSDEFRWTGEPGKTAQITLARTEPDGIWYPKILEWNDEINQSKWKLSVNKCEIDPELDDSIFTIDSFDVNSDTRTERIGETGSVRGKFEVVR